MATTTDTSRIGWSPDEYSTFNAEDIVPDALITVAASKAGEVEGDAPSVRVPYVGSDAAAEVAAEGAAMTEVDPTLAEATITTDKVAQLVRVSREQAGQPGAARRLAQSMSRAVTAKADDLFLNNASAPTGLLQLGGIATAGDLGGTTDPNVFAAYDAVAAIEADGGAPTHVLIHPSDWGTLSKLPQAADSNQSLLADVHDQSRRSLAGVPVRVSPSVAQGAALMLDASEVVAAYGQLEMARSDDAYFASDSVGLPCASGWGETSTRMLF